MGKSVENILKKKSKTLKFDLVGFKCQIYDVRIEILAPINLKEADETFNILVT